MGAWLEVVKGEESSAIVSELSELEMAGMAKSARNSVLIAAIRPH